jgi:hypothetical protein
MLNIAIPNNMQELSPKITVIGLEELVEML